MQKLVSSVVAVACFVGLGVGVVSAPQVAEAAAPMAKVAPAGFFRMKLGDFEVTALSDGTVHLPVNKILRNITEAQVDERLAAQYLKAPLETSVTAYLVNTGEKLVLIDSGAGKLFGPTLGNLLTSLRNSGYAPEQIDEVYITHMHGDHVGGLIFEGKRAFANATVRADKAEAAQWLSAQNLANAPEAARGGFQGAMASVNPYVEAGKFSAFEGSGELIKGVRAVSTKGHTPGHTSYLVESRGERLLVVGDMIHVGAIQFSTPSVTIQFDSNNDAARDMRLATFAQAEKDGTILAATHISFPGLGRLKRASDGYTWLPVNYTVVK